jgi:hypothetical protein
MIGKTFLFNCVTTNTFLEYYVVSVLKWEKRNGKVVDQDFRFLFGLGTKPGGTEPKSNSFSGKISAVSLWHRDGSNHNCMHYTGVPRDPSYVSFKTP